MGAIVSTDVDYGTVLINSCHVFNVTGDQVAEERVSLCRQPDLEWSKTSLSSLLSGKAKDCPEVLWSDKKYTIVNCGHLPEFWKITNFCGLRSSIWAWETITHNPAVSKRKKNHWLSWDHVTLGVTYHWYYKTSLVYQVKIYSRCLLILWNTRRTSYSQSKVLLYLIFPTNIY